MNEQMDVNSQINTALGRRLWDRRTNAFNAIVRNMSNRQIRKLRRLIEAVEELERHSVLFTIDKLAVSQEPKTEANNCNEREKAR